MVAVKEIGTAGAVRQLYYECRNTYFSIKSKRPTQMHCFTVTILFCSFCESSLGYEVCKSEQ